jgi:small nuclear ribonucleoprotein (snRNP)-like protein
MTRRIPRSERSLACFVQALEGLNIAVELHNDAVIRGMLESADEGMNLIITGATYEPLRGVTREMDFLFLRGARIRYGAGFTLIVLVIGESELMDICGPCRADGVNFPFVPVDGLNLSCLWLRYHGRMHDHPWGVCAGTSTFLPRSMPPQGWKRSKKKSPRPEGCMLWRSASLPHCQRE